MPRRIIVLSGHVCVGKTTLARLLCERYEAVHVKTSDCIRRLRPRVKSERRAMQQAGELLDRRDGGAWVLAAIRKQFEQSEDSTEDSLVVFDSARIQGQIDAVRRGYGNRVIHIHLHASRRTLSRRYAKRPRTDIGELRSYKAVLENPTESRIDELANTADIVISTERCTENDVLLRAASHAGLFGKDFRRAVDVLVGGQYGSEGKGQIAAYLSSEYQLLVRVGGPNAGHTVWQEPEPYVFHHIPSGANANPNAELVLGAGSLLNIQVLLREIADCQIESERLSIDPQAMIISSEDIATEATLAAAIGSTKQGVGTATARRILDRVKARGECTIAENVPELRPFVRPSQEILNRHYGTGSAIMLEGTQGTALSLYHGPYPYVTSRDTTVAGCLADAGISPSRVRKVLMVCRTYPIRVESPSGSTSGDMSLEISWREIAKRSGVSVSELEQVERTSTTRRRRRVGEFDWALLRSSASLNAPTDVALTFVDYLNVKNRTAARIEQLTTETLRFIEEIERVATAPVSLLSVRFGPRAIIDRRRW